MILNVDLNTVFEQCEVRHEFGGGLRKIILCSGQGSGFCEISVNHTEVDMMRCVGKYDCFTAYKMVCQG